jgi:hypothetical protein
MALGMGPEGLAGMALGMGPSRRSDHQWSLEKSYGN